MSGGGSGGAYGGRVIEPTASDLLDTRSPSDGPEPESAPTSRRRSWVAPVAVIAALGIGVGGTLAAVRPWQDDAAVSVTDDSAAADPADDADEPDPAATTRPSLPERRFRIDPLPEGYGVTWLNDPAELTDEELGMGGMTGTTVLLVGEGATLAAGPWLSVNSRVLDRFESEGWDPAMTMPTETSREVRVGEYEGAVGESWDGTRVLTFGPVDDDYVVTMNTEGLTDQQLATVGAGVVVEGGRPKLTAESLPMPMEVLATEDGMYDAAPMSLFNQYGASITVTYAEGGLASMATGMAPSLTLQHQISKRDDPLSVARFLLSDATDVEIDGVPAVLGGLDAFAGFGSQAVTWTDGGEAITLLYTGGDGELDLTEVAASVVEATPDEWDELVDIAEANQRAMEEVWANPPDAWFIGAGDLPDSTTWVVEGGFSDTGAFVASLSEMSSDGSSFGGGGGVAPGGEATPIPTVLVQTSGGSSQVVIGLGPVDPTGVVLRVTLDDGSVVDVPLRTVRPDWPASAAAWGFPNDAEGTAELVAADGSILFTTEIDAGPGAFADVEESATSDTAVATAATTAAAPG